MMLCHYFMFMSFCNWRRSESGGVLVQFCLALTQPTPAHERELSVTTQTKVKQRNTKTALRTKKGTAYSYQLHQLQAELSPNYHTVSTFPNEDELLLQVILLSNEAKWKRR
jgi:hypothetical protein